ncbi:MAG: hypothetical protein AB9897_01125 [Anaerolineaceae bacterium]
MTKEEEERYLEQIRKSKARETAINALWKEAGEKLKEIISLGSSQAHSKAMALLKELKSDEFKTPTHLMLNYVLDFELGQVIIFSMTMIEDGKKYFYVKVYPGEIFKAKNWEDALVKGFLWTAVVRKVREQIAAL